jgi:hypothetical protein
MMEQASPVDRATKEPHIDVNFEGIDISECGIAYRSDGHHAITLEIVSAFAYGLKPTLRDRSQFIRMLGRNISSQPTAFESRPTQTIDQVRAFSHQVPEEPSAMVFDHDHNRSLVQTVIAF